jgi:DNA-binding protein H-NS
MSSSGQSSVDISKLTVYELLLLRQQADKILKKRITSEKAALLRQLKELEHYEATIANHQPADLAHSSGECSKSKESAKRSAPPKFRDLDSAATWSGRGKQPRWLREAIANGRAIEDFRIK